MSAGTIMIVEDDKDLRDVYGLILKHAGYQICSSANGQEALQELDKCNPDLVLLDIFMPVMDGKAFLKKINLSHYPRMKVVVCSNTADNTLMKEMVQLGADKVVTKSTLEPSDLVTLVKPYLAAAS